MFDPRPLFLSSSMGVIRDMNGSDDGSSALVNCVKTSLHMRCQEHQLNAIDVQVTLMDSKQAWLGKMAEPNLGSNVCFFDIDTFIQNTSTSIAL